MQTYFLKTRCFENLIDSQINYFDNGNTIKLDYSNEQKVIISTTDKSPFFALVKIRLELEKLNMFVLCNGARINVYPSGMSLMGLLAYELIMNKQATTLVNIFEPFENNKQIGSVDEQKIFRDGWLKSLGK